MNRSTTSALNPPASTSPWLRVVFALLLAVLLGAGAGRLRFDNSTDAFFLRSDTTLARYEAFRQQFGSDEYTLISFAAPPQVDLAFVDGLRALEASIARLPHVRRVRSIASVRSIEGRGDELLVRGYLEGRPERELGQRVAQARQHAYYRDRFVSADGAHLGIVVETEVLPGSVDYKIELRNQLRAAIAGSAIAGLQPTLVGAPMTDAQVREIVQAESGQFGALVVLIVALGFLYLFRSLVAVAIPLLVVLLAVGSTFGLMGWLGLPATLLTPILPSFLISVGVGSSIFVLTQYALNRAASDGAPRDAARRAVAGVRQPCVLASLTTSAALLAFAPSDIAPVRDIGVLLGAGLLLALIYTFTLGSALLELMPPRVGERQLARLQRRSAWAQALDRFALRHQRVIFALAVLVTAAAAVAVTGLRSDYYYLGTFKPDTPIRQDARTSDARMPVSAVIEVVLETDAPGGFTNPELLRRLSAAQHDIEAYRELPARAYSVADVSQEIHQALHGQGASELRIPDSRQAVAQGLLLFESSGNDELQQLLSADQRVARLSVQLPTVPESRSSRLSAHVDATLARHFEGTPVRHHLTGLVPMWSRINGYLRQTQIESVLLAFGVTTLVLVVFARSLRLGLLLAFVNASVVLIVLGAMAVLGWALDPYTVLVADIAIGVLDDDTMHFFSAIRQGLADGLSLDEAVSAARSSAGQAMGILALCLVAGFSVYLLSSVASLAMFGTLAVLIFSLGLVWEWLVLPAYLGFLHRRGWLG